jgi:6-phosphogluconolactonase/glucosamine-6-phosphate isomerase/deaminase
MYDIYSGEKAEVLARVIGGDRTYPSARIASTSVTWLVDDAAAARLSSAAATATASAPKS